MIGTDDREIYSTLKIDKEEKDGGLKDVLDACRPKRNEKVERFSFNVRKLEPGETIETFITDLKTFAANCNFGEILDSLVRDRIVRGIIDAHLRDRLLMGHLT